MFRVLENEKAQDATKGGIGTFEALISEKLDVTLQA